MSKLNDIYFSYWAWGMVKTCPHKYKLRVLDKQKLSDTSKDAGSHIQGSVPHAQAEDFFNLPKNERDVGFFEDTFDKYWERYVKEYRIDYAKWGKYSLSKSLRGKIPYGYSSWEEYGYFVKQAETLNHSRNLAYLIKLKALNTREVKVEDSFRVVVEPRAIVSGVESPALIIGGRIDLQFMAPAGLVDIWDIKGVKDPKRLDDDQLMIYKLGVEGSGLKVRDTGYILVKQCEFLSKPILRQNLNKLKTSMRSVRQFFDVNHWPAKPGYYCKFCDVNVFCKVYQMKNRPFRPELVIPGKVPI